MISARDMKENGHHDEHSSGDSYNDVDQSKKFFEYYEIAHQLMDTFHIDGASSPDLRLDHKPQWFEEHCKDQACVSNSSAWPASQNHGFYIRFAKTI